MAPVIGLVVHPRNDVTGSVATVVALAAQGGARVVARAGDAARLGVDAVADDEFADVTDFVLSLGGDGTMLGAMRLLAGRPTPVLGVNHGNLGFLIETSPAQLPRALNRIIKGEFSLEPHSCLELSSGEVAFNDIVFSAPRPWSSVTLELRINDVNHGHFRSDAVVVCTSTGSTAYNYAAGGPVISPSVPVIAVTPVAPMSGISRSLILGGADRVRLHNDAATRISLDGAITRETGPGAELGVTLRPNAVNVVRFDRAAHERRNRVKLSLLDLPLRPDQLIELIPEELRDRARALRLETDG